MNTTKSMVFIFFKKKLLMPKLPENYILNFSIENYIFDDEDASTSLSHWKWENFPMINFSVSNKKTQSIQENN